MKPIDLPEWNGVEMCNAPHCKEAAQFYTPIFAFPKDKTSKEYRLWFIYATRQHQAWCEQHKYKLDRPLEHIEE
jgi:hypothetical protein